MQRTWIKNCGYSLAALILLGVGQAFAQQGNALILRFPGVPTGGCAPIMLAVNNAAGTLYACGPLGTWVLIGPVAGGAHLFLSATHTDTTAAAAVRGGAIFAVGGVPTWQQVAHSAAVGGYWKWNGTDVVASTGAAGGTGACTNQAVTAENADAAPTCSTITSSYVNNSIALTGTDINTSYQVTATHIAGATNTYIPKFSSGNLVNGVCTDDATNLTCPGYITSGPGAGAHDFVQGAAGAAPANSVGFQAPVSVTSAYRITLPGAPAAGVVHRTNATPSVETVSAVAAADIASGAISSIKMAAANKTFVKSIWIDTPVNADSGRVKFEFGQAVTLTRVACNVKGATSIALQLTKRTEADPEAGDGTTILTGVLTCAVGALATTNAFASAGIALRIPVDITLSGISGTPTDLRIFIEGTIDDVP